MTHVQGKNVRASGTYSANSPPPRFPPSPSRFFVLHMTTEIKGRRVHALINMAPYLLLTLKSDLLGLPLVVQALDVNSDFSLFASCTAEIFPSSPHPIRSPGDDHTGVGRMGTDMRSGVLLSTQVLVQQGGVCLNLLVQVWVTKGDDSVATRKQGVHTQWCLPLSCSGCLGNGEYHLGYMRKIVRMLFVVCASSTDRIHLGLVLRPF